MVPATGAHAVTERYQRNYASAIEYSSSALLAMSLGAIAARLPTGLRQASPATCRASVAR
jgi:hypothetical protein